MAGAGAMVEIPKILSEDPALGKAFGLKGSADQSVLQDTLNMATKENIEELRASKTQLTQENSLALKSNYNSKNPLIFDLDLTSHKASKNAQDSVKGYFPKDRGATGRQEARISSSKFGETLWSNMYPGNRVSWANGFFKQIIKDFEGEYPQLAAKENRQKILWRFDAGFGVKSSINFLLHNGHRFIGKIFSAKQVYSLVKKIPDSAWKQDPSSSHREYALLREPSRYGRKTLQIATRIPKEKGKKKAKNPFKYAVLITSELDLLPETFLKMYDKRAGIEVEIKGDKQGLGVTKRRKHLMNAQVILLLLNQLAHNLLTWVKHWLADSVPENKKIQNLRKFGPVRLIRDVFRLRGRIKINSKKVYIELSYLCKLAEPLVEALNELFTGYRVIVYLGES